MTLRIYAIIAAIVAVLGVIGWATWNHDAAKREKALRVAAEASSALAGETTKIIERTTNNERTVYRQAEVMTDAIQSAPGADDLVPPDVLGRWGAAIDGLRDGSEAADDQGSR